MESFFVQTNIQLFSVLVFTGVLSLLNLKHFKLNKKRDDRLDYSNDNLNFSRPPYIYFGLFSFEVSLITLISNIALLLAFNGGDIVSESELPWWFNPCWVTVELLMVLSVLSFIIEFFIQLGCEHKNKIFYFLLAIILIVVLMIFLTMFFICPPGYC